MNLKNIWDKSFEGEKKSLERWSAPTGLLTYLCAIFQTGQIYNTEDIIKVIFIYSVKALP